jgi:hypothetical protein
MQQIATVHWPGMPLSQWAPRFAEFRDSQLWDGDRIHLSSLGHGRFAAKVLAPMGDFRSNLRWTAAFAAPYIAKRMRLAKRGECVGPKLTRLTKVV